MPGLKLSARYLQAKALNDMGISYGMQENYAEAMWHFRQSIQIHQSMHNLLGVADGYNNLGIVYRNISASRPKNVRSFLNGWRE